MRNPMLARYFNLFLLFWATALSILLCPFAGAAQNAPTSINLEGTEWHGTVISKVNYSDNSIATIELTLAFGKRGKVAVIVLLSKSQGVSGIVVGGSIVTSVTPPVTKSQNVNGIYTINGNSVHVEFSDTTIDATMSGSEMKCVSTHESTGTEETWIAHRVTERDDSSSEETLPPNVVRNVDGKLEPASGYEWVNLKDLNDFRTKAIPPTKPGEIRGDDRSTVWALTRRIVPDRNVLGKITPANGYRWVNPDDPEDFRVERIP